MIQVYVTFPVHGNNEELAKQSIFNLLKNHFPDIRLKIDGAVKIPSRKARLIAQAKE